MGIKDGGTAREFERGGAEFFREAWGFFQGLGLGAAHLIPQFKNRREQTDCFVASHSSYRFIARNMVGKEMNRGSDSFRTSVGAIARDILAKSICPYCCTIEKPRDVILLRRVLYIVHYVAIRVLNVRYTRHIGLYRGQKQMQRRKQEEKARHQKHVGKPDKSGML